MKKKHKAHEEEHADETWLIPYADLLTLLLALFIVLFASSQTDSKKFENMMAAFNSVLSGGSGIFDKATLIPAGSELSNKTKQASQDQTSKNKQTTEQQFKQETENLQKLKKQIDEYIKKNGLSAKLETGLNSQQLVLRISDNALFASGSADVKPEARKLAEAISGLLGKYPNYQVVVSGHTDNMPISNARFQSNWDLSTERALNFMKILLGYTNLDPARFSAVGNGEYKPVASNSTEEGRAKNRRVEISILRNVKTDDTSIDIGK